MTQTHLGTVTVPAGGQASISFTGIPQTGFTDLLLVTSLRTNRASGVDVVRLTFNGSTTGYTDRHLIGFGSGAGYSETNSLAFIMSYTANGNTTAANTFASCSTYIPNYNGAQQKSVSIDGAFEDNVAGAWQNLAAGKWSGTAAITSLSITPQFGPLWMAGSTASLYGISNVNNLYPKATGGIITTDGAYVYHTFAGNGTFTPISTMSVDYLVVGGGGGGGSTNGGGGGAGGYLTGSSFSVTGASALTVTVGAGGAGGASGGSTGASGSNSVFSSITASGGGAGAGLNLNGGSGGSGGGGAGGATTSGGAGSAGQGYAGYGGTPGQVGGGGGGASAAATSKNGANGIQTTIGGTTTYYAGGGGGGTNSGAGGDALVAGVGGLGGGATGYNQASSGVPLAATPNTGGGGGGSGGNGSYSAGGTGGSGIVIIRYPK